jgi:simple sugar transport system permease protein/ribose transport system permease protein
VTVRRIVIAAAILVLIVVCATTPQFFTINNAKAILASASIVGLAALGATFIMIVGSIVSLATAQTMSVIAMVFLASQSFGLVPAILLALITGAVILGLQGVLVGTWSANPVVLSIAVAFALTGISTWVTGGTTVYPPSDGFRLLNITPLGIPLSVIVFVVAAVIAELVLRKTVRGQQLYLVGESRPAARAAGLPVARIITFAWVSGGLLTAIGALFLASFNTTATINLGGTVTFDAIAAVLAGGTAISGGKGSALRTVGGTLAIAIIADVLLLRGFSTGAQLLVKGLLVLGFVIAVRVRSNRVTR